MKNNFVYLTALMLLYVLNELLHASRVDEGGFTPLTSYDDLLKRCSMPREATAPHEPSCVEKEKIHNTNKGASEVKRAEDTEVLGPVRAHKLTETHRFAADIPLTALEMCIPNIIYGKKRVGCEGRESNASIIIPATLAENDPDTVRRFIDLNLMCDSQLRALVAPIIYGYDADNDVSKGIFVLCKIIREDGGRFFYYDMKEKKALERVGILNNVKMLEKVGIFEIDRDEYQKLLEIRDAADKANGYVFIPYALIKQDLSYEIMLVKEIKRETEKADEKEAEKETEKATEKSDEKEVNLEIENGAEKEAKKGAEKATEKEAKKGDEKETEKEAEKATEKETEKGAEKEVNLEIENGAEKEAKKGGQEEAIKHSSLHEDYKLISVTKTGAIRSVELSVESLPTKDTSAIGGTLLCGLQGSFTPKEGQMAKLALVGSEVLPDSIPGVKNEKYTFYSTYLALSDIPTAVGSEGEISEDLLNSWFESSPEIREFKTEAEVIIPKFFREDPESAKLVRDFINRESRWSTEDISPSIESYRNQPTQLNTMHPMNQGEARLAEEVITKAYDTKDDLVNGVLVLCRVLREKDVKNEKNSKAYPTLTAQGYNFGIYEIDSVKYQKLCDIRKSNGKDGEAAPFVIFSEYKQGSYEIFDESQLVSEETPRDGIRYSIIKYSLR